MVTVYTIHYESYLRDIRHVLTFLIVLMKSMASCARNFIHLDLINVSYTFKTYLFNFIGMLLYFVGADVTLSDFYTYMI